MPKGYKGTSEDWVHVTIWVKPSEWDKILYNFASSGKESVSQYVIDKLMEIELPPETERKNNKRMKKGEEKGCIKPLCVPKDKWEIVKEKANLCGLKVSPYVLAVLLG